MYYEVDVDLLFLENLWMNIILLLLTAWCCRLPVIFRRILLSAVLGSGGACVMPVYSAALRSAAYFFCMLVLSAAMTAIGLPGKKKVSAGSGGALSGRICIGWYLTIPENAGSFWRNTHLAGRRDKCSDIADSGRISQKPQKESQSFKGDHAVLRCQENSGACLV